VNRYFASGMLLVACLFGCADEVAPASDTSEEALSKGVFTEAQAKQRVLDLYGKLGAGDLDGFVAGVHSDARWHVNAATLPWGGADAIGPAGVKGFFLKALSIVAITKFAPIPNSTYAQRVDTCRFAVVLKADEALASLRDESKTVAFTIRESVIVNCQGQIVDADIYYDSGAIEHMLKAAGDI
jgi:hypothetical protein